MNAKSFFFSGNFGKIGTGNLFPIKRQEKPNLYRRKRTLDGEVIGGQSWLIGGQRQRLKTIQTLCRLERLITSVFIFELIF